MPSTGKTSPNTKTNAKVHNGTSVLAEKGFGWEEFLLEQKTISVHLGSCVASEVFPLGVDSSDEGAEIRLAG